MKLAASLLSIAGLVVCLLATPSGQAALYKSVGPNGQVTYSDIPPESGKIVEKKSLTTSNESDTSGLPYLLAQAKKNSPVTLYTSAVCIPCDDGRQLLNRRGIPFSEKTVNNNEDIARVKAIGGENQLPLLLIGSRKESGFETNAWNTALSAAGYPTSNQLPGNYRNGQTTSAAPATALIPAKSNAAAGRATTIHTENDAQLPAAGNTPRGFQF